MYAQQWQQYYIYYYFTSAIIITIIMLYEYIYVVYLLVFYQLLFVFISGNQNALQYSNLIRTDRTTTIIIIMYINICYSDYYYCFYVFLSARSLPLSLSYFVSFRVAFRQHHLIITI